MDFDVYEKKPLIIIAGPTGVGKSDLAVMLARKISGEVISADSMQVYRGMDIGTAKLRPEEMQGVPHHLIDVCDPAEDWSVVRFQQMAKEAMAGIYGRGHIPILCGGTGFYIQALLYDIAFTEGMEDSAVGDAGDMKDAADAAGNAVGDVGDTAGTANSMQDMHREDRADSEAAAYQPVTHISRYRRELEARAAAGEGPALYEEMKAIDPDSALAIHPNNLKRVIRALEYYRETGRPISAHNREQRGREAAYDSHFFVITDDRDKLYSRTDLRVERMLEAGLVDEVLALKAQGFDRSYVSMQGLGYKEILAYLDGDISYEEAVRVLKRDTRHFAKRQLTWFRRERDVIWLSRQDYPTDQALLEAVLRACPPAAAPENPSVPR